MLGYKALNNLHRVRSYVMPPGIISLMQAFRQEWAGLSSENVLNSKGVEFNSCCTTSINLIFSRFRRGGRVTGGIISQKNLRFETHSNFI